MKLTFERKLPIILFFVILMLAAIGFVFYQNTVSLQEAIGWEHHAQEVVGTLENTLAIAIDSEAEQRGFLITGNTTYLDRYERIKGRVDRNLTTLRTLHDGVPEQLQELSNLDAALNEYWKVADGRIEVRKQGGYEASTEVLSLIETKGALDNVRTAIDRMKSREETILQSKSRSLDRNLYVTIWLLGIASVAGILALVVANVLVFTEGRRRRRAEGALVDANRDLEDKIEKRTEELKQVNESLTAIAGERERLLRQEQEARHEAEIANRLRDEFMATVSHELRTPLNSILGWARLMNGGTLDEGQARKALRTIIKNSETQNRLIEDLLDVARLISGKLELDTKPVRIAEIVNHSIESVKPEAAVKGISIRNGIQSDVLSTEVIGDPNRLEQIFSNLLTNAVKFTPQGGSVDVRIASENGGSLSVEIEDTGTGISPEFLPSVFERFRQDVKAETPKSGLGLGLAIVRNLVEMHGGTVSAKSEGTNKGALFKVTLPVAEN